MRLAVILERAFNSDTTSENRAGSRRAWVLGVVIIWLVLSLISASQRYADSLQTSSPFGFSYFLLWSLVIWSYWAMLTPLIFRLGERIPFNRERLGLATAAHFALSLGTVAKINSRHKGSSSDSCSGSDPE